MEIERLVIPYCCVRIEYDEKQRKSPENGDWKLSVRKLVRVGFYAGNKENLLKMEIESFRFQPSYVQIEVRNKENLLKMEIESHPWYKPEPSSS